MNQSSNEASGMNLPPPVGEQTPAGNAAEESGVQPAEQAPAAPETAPHTGQSAPAATPAILLPNPPAAPAQAQNDGVINTTQKSGAAIINDNDLIEKEWVNKAKRIVEHTRDDPYAQSEQITGVRVDYMKKNYNKTVKLK